MSDRSRLRLAMAGLHPDRARALLIRYGSASRAVEAIEHGLVKVSSRARSALARSDGETAEMLDSLGITVLLRGCADYPESLARFPDAPDVLFARGALSDAPAVAVVGTRTCTAYGRALARCYGRAAGAAGWSVVSGLARGIDGEAHRGVLDAGGHGVAVLGSGSNVVYPSEHRALHDALVAAGGAVLTEYPPGTPPEGWRFPPRNRIIAGLAGVVVVVEARVTGGALITASAALDQGKAVMAVPGDVGRDTSRGCNLLIRDGAIPVLEPDDLVAALSLVLGPPCPRVSRHPESEDRDQEAVMQSVRAGGSTLDDLTGRTGVSIERVRAAVGHLEASGRLQRVGDSWVACFET